MRLYVCGDQARSHYLREAALKKGLGVTCLEEADVVVLPLPRSDGDRETIGRLRKGQWAVCGLMDEAAEQALLEKGCRIVRVYRDEQYLVGNSRDSAEGAVWALMGKAAFALSRARCLVIGFGRLGKALKAVLEGMGAETVVAARSPEQRAQAGADSLTLAQAFGDLSGFDAVINTVPARILGRAALSTLRPGSLLMDTASAPYGFSVEEACALRLTAWRENGIPGRYCPMTAAERLLALIEREVK